MKVLLFWAICVGGREPAVSEVLFSIHKIPVSYLLQPPVTSMSPSSSSNVYTLQTYFSVCIIMNAIEDPVVHYVK